MTQAFNLSQLANNLNTSGQLDATDGLTGAVPVANGGTGATSLSANAVILGNGTGAVQTVAPSTSGNILTSNGTTWVSQAPSGGGVTSLNGQTGAITNTNFNAIGSYVVGTSNANSAGSMSRNSTYSGSSISGFSGSSSSGGTIWGTGQNTNLGLSGTWRAMGTSVNSTATKSGNFTVYGSILVRIS